MCHLLPVTCHSNWVFLCGGASHWRVCYEWDKQWKSCRSCLEKVALGRSRGQSDFLEGRSPKGMSDYPRDLPWANFQIFPKAFPLLVRLQASKNQSLCVPQELSEHILGFPQGSLTMLNPDFGFWIKKSGLSLGPSSFFGK